MIDAKLSGPGDDDFIRRTYSKANRFAWMLLVCLAFIGNIAAELILHDTTASMLLGALCIIGIISRELYLNWAFGGVSPPEEAIEAKPTWWSIAVRAVVITAVWLVPDISEGRLSGRSFIFAIAVGGGAALFFWWQEIHSPAKKESVP
jgi:hypothetical protein